jgi:hypothetical protein
MDMLVMWQMFMGNQHDRTMIESYSQQIVQFNILEEGYPIEIAKCFINSFLNPWICASTLFPCEWIPLKRKIC